MAANNIKQKPKQRPSTDDEGRENQLIALAIEAAEKQLREGSASSQVITHFLKLGSSREQLEQERLRKENDLLRVKAETAKSLQRIEELYAGAIDAMKRYSPSLETDEL